MMKLVSETDPILRTECLAFDFQSPICDPYELVYEMAAVMKLHRGLGLAAPQVGVSTRVFIMENEDGIMSCFNPEIIAVSSSSVRDYEGCLSFPRLWLKIERPDWVETRFHDADGTSITKRLVNPLSARCFAHELEHLAGIVFTDKVGPLALKMARNRRKKMKGHS